MEKKMTVDQMLEELGLLPVRKNLEAVTQALKADTEAFYHGENDIADKKDEIDSREKRLMGEVAKLSPERISNATKQKAEHEALCVEDDTLIGLNVELKALKSAQAKTRAAMESKTRELAIANKVADLAIAVLTYNTQKEA